MTIKLITDSPSDLPQSIIEKYNIEVLPLYVTSGSEQYKDRLEISPEKLYNDMRVGKVYKTSQIPLADFVEKFREYGENGGSYLYLAFSSGLSGTYQAAVLASQQVKEDYPELDLEIIDTKCVSLGLGLVVSKVAQAIEKKEDKTKIVELAKYYSRHMEHIFTVDDLEYLLRGGRVSRTAAFVGSILNIKPILDVENGKLIPIEKKKGRKRALKRIVDIMEERGTNLKEQAIGISHGDDLEAAELVKEMITERFGCKNFVINTVGAVVGAHSGPGTLAVFFVNENGQVNEVE